MKKKTIPTQMNINKKTIPTQLNISTKTLDVTFPSKQTTNTNKSTITTNTNNKMTRENFALPET